MYHLRIVLLLLQVLVNPAVIGIRLKEGENKTALANQFKDRPDDADIYDQMDIMDSMDSLDKAQYESVKALVETEKSNGNTTANVSMVA